jgi:hypothetical protein
LRFCREQLDGNDVMKIQLATGSALPSNGIFFDGGSGINTLDLVSGSFTSESYNATSPHAGTIILDGSLIGYANLAPIIDTITVTNLHIDDSQPNDRINVLDDPNSPQNGSQTTQLLGNGFELIDFANKNHVTVNDTVGGATFNLNNSNPATGLQSLNLAGGGTGGEAFNLIGGNFGPTLNITGSGANNSLTGPTSAETWHVTGINSGDIQGLVTSFTGIQNLTGGTGADSFVFSDGAGVAGTVDGGGGAGKNTLDYHRYSTPITVNLHTDAATGIGGGFKNIQNLIGGAGSDTLIGADTPNTWHVSGPDTGDVNGTFTFSSIENLIGGAGDDRIVIQTGGRLSGGIDGGSGNNTLDYSPYVGNITVDLALGTATGVGKGVRHAENVTGSIGNDLLVGDALPNTLMGGTGGNVIIGGAGADNLIGGGDDNIIIGGSTAYDTNLTALTAIMAEWTRTDLSFEQRLADLINDAPPARALNGPYHLNKKTVFDDNAANVLTGGGGLDWFFVGQDDTVLNRKPRDHITQE